MLWGDRSRNAAAALSQATAARVRTQIRPDASR